MKKPLQLNQTNYNRKDVLQDYVIFFVLYISILILLTNSAFAQNAFYIKGALFQIEEGALLHIEGDIHVDNNGSGNNNKGLLLNDGIIQVRGNFVFESDNVEQITDNSSMEGIVRFKNYDSGWYSNSTLENKAQRIIIESGASAEGDAAFHTIEIENEDRDGTSSDENYVDILYNGSGVATVEVKGQLVFKNQSRFITENASTGSRIDGSDYACELFISNTASDAINFNGYYNLNTIDFRAQAGSTTRYVEGVLSRAVNGTNSYYFPVGLSPNFVGNDGMAAFNIETTGANGQKIRAYVNGDDVGTLNAQTIYSDVGTDPGIGIDNFSDCIGAPDGIYDRIILNQPISHEWQIDNDGVQDFDYNIEFFPGVGLNATASNSTNLYSCGSNDFVIRYISKDGYLYDRTSGTLITPELAPTPFNSSGTATGYLFDPPVSITDGNRINGLSSFSTFRIHSAENTATVLPVELLYVAAESINNSFIEITWATASELNNDFFEIQRSMDAILWENIGIVNGFGNSSITNHYQFLDENVQPNLPYYYRLNQVDFDGSNTYSNVVSESISSTGNSFEMREIYPNPVVKGEIAMLLYTSPIQRNFNYEIINMTGQSLSNKDFLSLPPGTNRYAEISVSILPVGNYVIRIWDDQEMYYKKLIVTN